MGFTSYDCVVWVHPGAITLKSLMYAQECCSQSQGCQSTQRVYSMTTDFQYLLVFPYQHHKKRPQDAQRTCSHLQKYLLPC